MSTGAYHLFAPVAASFGYWDSKVKSVVVDALQRAQMWQSLQDRQRWQALHAMYDGKHEALVRAHIAFTHPERAEEWNEGDASGHRYLDLVRMLVDRLGVVFHRPPETFLHLGDGKPLPEDDARVQQWRKDETAIDVGRVLQRIDAWTVLFGQCIPRVAWVHDRPRWVVHAPYEVFVDQDPAEPEEIDFARHVSVEIRQPVDSIGKQLPSLYLTYRYAPEEAEPWQVWFHDEDGRRHANKLFGNNVNEYGLHPLVVFRGANYPAPGTFWTPPNAAWFRHQLAVNLQLMDLDFGLRYQVHPQGVLRGHPDEEKPTLGPSRLLKFPGRGSHEGLEYVSADLKVDELLEAINAELRLAAVAEGLPPDTFEANSSTRNMGAKQVEQHALKLRRERVMPAYKRDLAKLFDITRAVCDHWAPTSNRIVYGDDVQLGVNLAPIPEAHDRFQDMQANETAIRLGLTGPVDLLMRSEGITRREAEERLDRNIADRERYGYKPSAPAAATAGHGVRRPPSAQE
ncbi:MAG: hypothetical protein CMK74_12355 [Pseudomonadales bacterium]|nr:hypothetical protein [Pseudomonadales bacterium]